MENHFYSAERNVQILIAVLKANGIKKVVASPGTTNYTFVASIQQDSFFEIYSSIDERSAAYIACGLAAESEEPVVLSCTGATASRNYMPGLTEAFYRKLPILAVTSNQGNFKIGQHIAQVIDRRILPNDIAKLSVDIPLVKDRDSEWFSVVKINEAVLELNHHGGGPVHINLATNYSRDFSVKEIPPVNVIRRLILGNDFPQIPQGHVGVFLGAHKKFSPQLTELVNAFCSTYNGVVFCDHTSNYYGKYRVNCSLLASQDRYLSDLLNLDLLIHIGEVSGEYYGIGRIKGKQVWRVSEDGQIRDTFRKLTCVFEMKEEDFFAHYAKEDGKQQNFLISIKEENDFLISKIPELPYSNIWIASQLSKQIPPFSIMHFGILGSLRAWNFFEVMDQEMESSNTGGFGIDGGLSTLVGASFANPQKLHFGIFGDLAFFYDLNSLGNRHIGKNLRIMLINNGKGAEFRLYWHPASVFKEKADDYMAAAHHFADKSPYLIRHYAQDLGFKYITASSKEEFLSVYSEFVEPTIDKSVIFEVFINSEDEDIALYTIRNFIEDDNYKKRHLKQVVKNAIGDSVVKKITKFVK